MRRRAVLVAALGALAACGRTGPPPPLTGAAGDGPVVIERGADVDEGARLVAGRARTADVLYLGELHDNPEHHAIQARVLAAVAVGGRPAVGLEMVDETRQAELDAAVRGTGDAAEVDRRLEWQKRGWPDFAMYWPLLALARARGLATVALDLDPGLTRRVSRDGLGAAGLDAARLRSALPDDPARDQAITRRIRSAHCDMVSESRAARMLDSWYARNVVIARRLAGALERSPQVVVIIGRGHQSPGGVPDQLAALRPGTRQLVVAFVETTDAPDREPAAPTADIVWRTGGRERADPCRGLPQRLGRAAAPGVAGRTVG